MNPHLHAKKLTTWTLQCPFVKIRLESDEHCHRLASRSVSIYAIFEVWGEGTDHDSLHGAVKTFLESSEEARDRVANKSFKFKVVGFNRSFGFAEQLKRIESFAWMNWEGKVEMKNPEERFWVLELFRYQAPETESYTKSWLVRQITDSSRPLIETYTLKNRRFLGTTSMESEISFFSSNQVLAGEGKLIFDPFVGTGSLLITSAALGAHVMGADIDPEVLVGSRKVMAIDDAKRGGRSAGKYRRTAEQEAQLQEQKKAAQAAKQTAAATSSKANPDSDKKDSSKASKTSNEQVSESGNPSTEISSELPQTSSSASSAASTAPIAPSSQPKKHVSKEKRGVRANFEQYGLEHKLVDLVIFDSSKHTVFKTLGRQPFLDGIVCDPPYGIRAGAKKIGVRQHTVAKHEKRGTTHAPILLNPEDPGWLPHTPQCVPYSVPDVLTDLLDFSARSLRVGGRLVFWLPTTIEFQPSDLPTHPCFTLIANSEQRLTYYFSRRLITMEKVADYDPSFVAHVPEQRTAIDAAYSVPSDEASQLTSEMASSQGLSVPAHANVAAKVTKQFTRFDDRNSTSEVPEDVTRQQPRISGADLKRMRKHAKRAERKAEKAAQDASAETKQEDPPSEPAPSS